MEIIREPAAGDACQGYGVTTQHNLRFPELNSSVISAVTAGSPAALAGLEEGDALLQRDRRPARAGRPASGDTIDFVVHRSGAEQRLTMIVGAMRADSTGRLVCHPWESHALRVVRPPAPSSAEQANAGDVRPGIAPK